MDPSLCLTMRRERQRREKVEIRPVGCDLGIAVEEELVTGL